MKPKNTIWFLCAAVLASVLANIMIARENVGYFDEAYGEMAKQHLLNSTIRSRLEHGDVASAKALLDQEIHAKGTILAICLMEACSSSAADVMQYQDGGLQ
jgi:hypothetical protein